MTAPPRTGKTWSPIRPDLRPGEYEVLDAATFERACAHCTEEHRAFSDERKLWRRCPLARCRRARSCRDPDHRTCLHHVAARAGNNRILREMVQRMADSGSPLLPWREMAEDMAREDLVRGRAAS